MATVTNQPRAQKGKPTGGQFTTGSRPEPATELRTQALDPVTAHHLNAMTLLNLLPGTDQRALSDVRHELARRIQAGGGRGRPFTTWQEAWNDLIAANGSGHGTLRLPSTPCPACHGRGFSSRNVARNLTRTGHATVCGECMGRRRTSATLPARRAD